MARFARLVVVALLVLVTALTPLGISLPASAAAVTPFGTRFQTNDNGAITTVGNNLMSCPPAAANCLAARAGTAKLNNNSFTMQYADADNDPSTFDSSSAQLGIPATGSVLWAGLYWGARISAGASGTSGVGNRRVMSFKVPGSAGYRAVTSQAEFGPTPSDLAYQQFADVTADVQAAGAGTYWGANVVAGSGQDRYAGWALVVAYRSPDLPLRNLTVFDGFADVGQGNPQTITIDGFLAPLSGAVDAQLGMVAYEGDGATSGDSAALNSTQLGTSLSPGTNFFNSTNDGNGTSVTARSPADTSMLGYDIKSLGASGVIPNGARSATLSFTSSGDKYYPGVLTTAINLYAPDFTPSTKTVVDLNGNSPAQPGDTLEYTLDFSNTGQDPAASSIASDPLPAGTTYVPGSLTITRGANAGAKTDAAGDDQAEYDAATRRVVARLGTGADEAAGGVIAPGAGTAMSFDVTLDPDAGGSTVTNEASLAYVAQTVGTGFTYRPRPVSTAVQDFADLTLTKSIDPDPALAGGPIGYTLSVTNSGPNTARSTVVTDPVPAGTVVSDATSSRGSCTVGGAPAVVTCAVGDLPVGAPVNIRMTGTSAPTDTEAAITNVAQVSADTPDPNLADNTAGATAQLSQAADLSVTKAADPATVTPGGRAGFVVTVTNDGPSTARNVSITDAVSDPAALALLGASGAGITCSSPAPGIQCTVQQLAPGASVAVAIDGLVSSAADTGTVLDDTATVSSSTPDPDATNNQATASLTVSPPSADVRMTKAADATAIAGRTVTYTLTAVNFGPSDAAGVVVTDPLPAGVVATTASSTRGTCTVGTTVTCAVGSLVAGPPGQPGATATITVDAMVAADTLPGPLVNTATATSTSADSDTSNNTASATTQVQGESDLAVTKTATPNPAVPGAPITYTVTIADNGPSTARGVTLSDALPGAFSFTSAAASQGSCSAPVGGAIDCTIGAIPNGSTATVTVTMLVPADYTGTPVATETATASSSTTDPDPANDVASWTASTSASADLALSKTGPSSAVAGTTISYTLQPRNLGPSTASAASVVDTLPAGVTFVSASAGCTFAAGAPTGQVTCTLATLAPGVTPDLTVTVRIAAGTDAGAVLRNTATVGSATADPSAANNTDAVTTEVVAVADLSVTKSVFPGSGPAGGEQVFIIDVTNNGPSTARNVSFVDHFEAEAGAVPLQGADCTISNGDLECAITPADIPPGGTAEVLIGVILGSSVAEGDYVNTVHVASTTPDPALADNVATASVTVTAPEADLAIAKTSLTDPIVAGSTFSYELQVTNVRSAETGSDAHDVVVTDALPAGLTATTASPSQGSCDIVGGTVSCSLGVVPGQVTEEAPPPVTIILSGTVAPSVAGSVANTASVTSTTADPVASNNSATVTTPVEERAALSVTKVPDNDPLVAGATAGYTIAVTNAGPSDADNVVLSDLLNGAIAFDPAQSDSSCSNAAGSISCALGTITAGTTASVRVVGILDPSTTLTSLTNTASVTTDTTDPDPADNSSTVTSAVTRQADLALRKTVDSTTPTVGSTVVYTLNLSNSGPSDAASTAIVDTLPAGTRLVSVTPHGATCTTTTGATTTVRCAPPGLAAGSSAMVEIAVGLPDGLAPGRLINSASATAATDDPDTANNTATAPVTVQVVANTSVTKTITSGPVTAGSPVTYRLTAVNNGPASAPDAVFTDTLPAGTTLQSARVETGSGVCTTTQQEGNIVVDCPVGRLSVGATASVLLTLATSPGLSGELANTGYIGSGALDPATPNNRATATALVNPVGSTPPPTTPTPTPSPSPGPSTTVPPQPGAAGTGGSGGLPDTGSNIWLLVQAGCILVGAGAASLLLVRRFSPRARSTRSR